MCVTVNVDMEYWVKIKHTGDPDDVGQAKKSSPGSKTISRTNDEY